MRRRSLRTRTLPGHRCLLQEPCSNWRRCGRRASWRAIRAAASTIITALMAIGVFRRAVALAPAQRQPGGSAASITRLESAALAGGLQRASGDLTSQGGSPGRDVNWPNRLQALATMNGSPTRIVGDVRAAAPKPSPPATSQIAMGNLWTCPSARKSRPVPLQGSRLGWSSSPGTVGTTSIAPDMPNAERSEAVEAATLGGMVVTRWCRRWRPSTTIAPHRRHHRRHRQHRLST